MRWPEALPELRGRWLTAYKVLWFTLLALGVAGLTVGTWQRERIATAQDMALYGAGLRLTEEGQSYTVTPISPEARAAGIAAESELLAVDGRAVDRSTDWVALDRLTRSLAGPKGDELALTMRAPDGRVAVHRVTRGPHHLAAADREAPITYTSRAVLYLAMGLAGMAIALAASVLLFMRRKGDPVVALLALGLMGQASMEAAWLVPDPWASEQLYGWTNGVFGIALLLAMAVFPAGRFSPRWTVLLVPSLFVWAVALRVSAIPDLWGTGMTVILIAAIAIALILRYLALPAGPQRQQIKWAVLGFSLFLMFQASALVMAVIDRGVEGNTGHFALLIATRIAYLTGFLALVLGLVVSVLRHRLYDADQAISRSAVYAGLTVALIAVFAATEKLIETLGEEWFGASAGAAAGAIAAGLAALLLVPLHHRMSHWAEQRFQRDLARMRARLPELLAEMRDSSAPDELADDALRLALRGVRASRGAILLASDGRLALAHAEGLSDEHAERFGTELPPTPAPGLERTGDPELPLRLALLTPGGVLAGWLLLGPHPDGSLYGKDDREALEELASPLARALCLALERARREAEREAAGRKLARRMTRLEKKLGELVGQLAPRAAGTA